jgi:hypothetical protein
LTVEQILAWADAYHATRGRWPQSNSGPVPESPAPGDTWAIIHGALSQGLRGLPGGSSLAALLQGHRGVRNKQRLPRLTVEQILAWADAYHEAHGEWPQVNSGPVPESPAPGDTWALIYGALVRGQRGLPGGLSLARLLADRRDVRPPLTFERILAWADAHHRAHGRWPTRSSGAVAGVHRETWNNIDMRLMRGERGLPRGWTLVRLLAEYRGRVPGGSCTSFGQPRDPRVGLRRAHPGHGQGRPAADLAAEPR